MEQIIIDDGSLDKKPGEKPKKEDGRRMPFNAPDGELHYLSSEEIEEQFDMEYSKKIDEFISNETIKGYEKYPENAELNQKIRKDLQKLSNNENIKNLKPEEFSFALAYLIGQMDYNPDADKEAERLAQQAKEIFMEGCRKIYPHVDETHPTDPRRLSSKLSKMGGALFSDNKFDVTEAAEIRKVGNIEPDIHKLKDMAKKLQELLSDITRENKDFVYKFQLENDKETSEDGAAYVKEYKEKKAVINECIYEFILIRDIVYEKLYGNKNISVDEAKKIDEAREKIENN